MPILQMDPQSIYQGNIKKYEEKLTNPMMKFNERGMIFVTWYQICDRDSTYDSGFGQTDELLGKNSGSRYNKIEHLGVALMNETDVNVTEEVPGVLDITQEGSLLIFPNTIVPNPDRDYFVIEHLQMRGVFRCTGVDYDHMRVDGYRKCDYILEGTDTEILDQLERQVVETYVMQYSDFGTSVSPIIRKDHADYIKRLDFMYADMVELYMSTFYDERHECLLYYNPDQDMYYYDECLQHFINRHALLSIPNSDSLVVFDTKLEDPKFNQYYNWSVWRWIERDAPQKLLQKFPYTVSNSGRYKDSSFYHWGSSHTNVIWPIHDPGLSFQGTYFDGHMYNVLEGNTKPLSSYEEVLKHFVDGTLRQAEQIPLNTYQEMLDGCGTYELFAYTPMILYIIRLVEKFR